MPPAVSAARPAPDRVLNHRRQRMPMAAPAAQPRSVVASEQAVADQVAAFERVQIERMFVDARERAQDVVADALALLNLQIDDHPVEAEAASLEAVEGVDEVVVLGRFERLLLAQVAADALQVAGDGRGLVDR